MPRFLLVLLLGLGLLFTSETVRETPFVGPKVLAVSGMEQIRLGDWQLLQPLTMLGAAKNEYEGFQLLIRAPKGGLSNVRVEVQSFQNENGETLPPPTLYREHYVYAHAVERDYYKRETFVASNLPQGAGWYADALIPFEVDEPTARFQAQPFEVASFQNQGIWIDVYVPEGARAGLYTSQYTVSSNQGEITGELRLTVWDFTLPKSPSLGSSFLVWKHNEKAMYIELLKHKLMPDYVEGEYQAELIEDWGLRLGRLGFVGGANYQNCAMRAPPSPADMEEAASAQDERLSLYIYPADEITDCTNLTPELRAWAEVAHNAGVRNLIPMFPRANLYEGEARSAVDIWVIYATQLMAEGAFETIREVLDKGDEVWSYTALAAEPHAPQWGVNYSAFDFRLLAGFINLRYSMTGLLYWRVDNWSKDPWRAFQVIGDPSNYPAGEGMLVYPGEAVGVKGIVPSIRLKWLRDGIEDYEYGQLLKTTGKQDELNAIVQNVAKDWYHWTKNVTLLEQSRQKLAETIVLGQE
jgi:Domain of unknown function (DUF4091)